jgi:hypothetical protein
MNQRMSDCNYLAQAHYYDQDDLDSALTQSGLALDVLSNAATPLNVEIRFRHTPCARVLSASGEPVSVARGSRQVSRDDGEFLGVLFQRIGHTFCSQRGQHQVIKPGEITVWHGRQSLDFRMPERFCKLCLLVPIDRPGHTAFRFDICICFSASVAKPLEGGFDSAALRSVASH